MAKAIGDGVSNFLNDDGNHTLAPTPSPTPSPHGSTTGNETDQDIMEYFLIGIVCIMFLFTISTFGMSMIRGCKHTCKVFSRHGCKGCIRYCRGRRPESGDDPVSDSSGAGILNEIIFDPEEQQQPQRESEDGPELTRGLLQE